MKKLISMAVLLIVTSGCQRSLERTNPMDPLNTTGNSSGQTFSGTVKAQDMAIIPNALISCSNGTSVTADSQGNYSILITPGNHTLTYSASWYQNSTSSITVPASNTVLGVKQLALNQVLSDNFDSYNWGSPPPTYPLSPWSWSGTGGSVKIDDAYIMSGYSCWLFSGAVGGQMQISYNLPAPNLGYRISAKISVKNITSSFKMMITTSIGTPVLYLSHVCLPPYTSNTVKYQTMSTQGEGTASLNFSDFYEYFIDVDKDANRVNFAVKLAYGGAIVDVFENKQIWPGASQGLDKLVFLNVGEGAGINVYVDDVTVIAK